MQKNSKLYPRVPKIYINVLQATIKKLFFNRVYKICITGKTVIILAFKT